MEEFIELETERLVLRKIRTKDCQILWDNFFSDYETYKFYKADLIPNVEKLKKQVSERVKKQKSGNYYRWAIIEKESNKLIGNINIHHVNKIDSSAKIGYFIFKEYQNKGFATESLKEVLKFATNKLKFHRITASAAVSNVPSNKVLIKCGFNLEGTMKESNYIDGKYYDTNIYAIVNKI